MILSKVAKQAEKFVIDNSPTVLTIVGVAGTAVTAYLTGKASFKAGVMMSYKHQTDAPPTVFRKEELKHVWKFYIPAATAGLTTASCIIGANRISTSRAAAIVAAYSLSEKRITEYKEKVLEKVGVNKERALRDELEQDRVNKNSADGRQVIITGNGDVLCFDSPAGRYFKSNMESIRRVQNDLNQEVIANGYATLSDLYGLMGLKNTPYSDEVGWTSDKMLELIFTTTLTDDGQPCIAIDYSVEPIRGYKHQL